MKYKNYDWIPDDLIYQVHEEMKRKVDLDELSVLFDDLDEDNVPENEMREILHKITKFCKNDKKLINEFMYIIDDIVHEDIDLWDLVSVLGDKIHKLDKYNNKLTRKIML